MGRGGMMPPMFSVRYRVGLGPQVVAVLFAWFALGGLALLEDVRQLVQGHSQAVTVDQAVESDADELNAKDHETVSWNGPVAGLPAHSPDVRERTDRSPAAFVETAFVPIYRLHSTYRI